MLGWSVGTGTGVRPLRNEKPRMGVRGSLGGGMIGLLTAVPHRHD